ncbi:MAG: TfoX/Sxy family protein [Anaeroplasmataceae bacterium]|nr:TfoX/Sxy family protein [Anaeroplasmataceae bacterium]
MACKKELMEYYLESLGDQSITARSMMGGYCIYKNGVLIGGIYQDRLMFKQTDQLKQFLKEFKLDIPYEGSKQKLIWIENVDDISFMRELALHL